MASRVRPEPGHLSATADALPVVLRPTREPDFRQDRARRSYLALLAAATALFSARGYDAVGTPEIAQRAGVSVGTFYRYFDDKHEIYLEIARRTFAAAYCDTLAHLVPARFAGRARHETIRETIAILFDHVLSQPALLRSFREMSLRDAAVGELAHAFEQLAVARIADLIRALVSHDVVPDPEATAWVVHASVLEAAYGLAGHRGPPPISAARARQAVADVIERAVFPPG